MTPQYPFRTHWCLKCDQGWVEIMKEKSSGNFFVRCRECIVQWNHPQEVTDLQAGFRFVFGEATDPTIEEIRQQGWVSYLQEQPNE